MSHKEQSFHPYWAWTVDDDGKGAIGTSQDQPGITQRLWVGTHLLAALVGPLARADLGYYLGSAGDWASAADAMACALIAQQQETPGLLTAELLAESLGILERRRRERDTHLDNAIKDAVDPQKGGQTP